MVTMMSGVDPLPKFYHGGMQFSSVCTHAEHQGLPKQVRDCCSMGSFS